MSTTRSRKRKAPTLGERLQESSLLKDEVLGVLAHELRSSLNAVVGWAHLLRRGGLDAETTTRGLEAIQKNADLQSQSIASGIDAFVMIGGELPLRMRPMDLNRAVMGALVAQKAAAEARQVQVLENVEPAPARVMGDADRLQRAIGRLVANAVRFTPGGGRVGVSLTRGDDHFEVVVQDTGCGIAPDLLAGLEQRCRKPVSSRERVERGRGLGVAIVCRLAELHGGAFELKSAGEGKGATAILRLPASRAGRARPRSRSRAGRA